ncbi:ATP-binding protein [Rhodopseudomonas rhenobacensis]|nr:ATP-binding protein [Rhodopseudomonas rhenobacensis]
MWRTLSLRGRLNALLALLLVLGLALNIARLLLEAAPRIQAEDNSVVRLGREFVQTLIAGLGDSPDPAARLAYIIDDLSRLRHISISREAEGGSAAQRHQPRLPDPETTELPAWFVRLVHPQQTTLRVPVEVNGQSLGALVITSHPIDEMTEIWDGIVTQLEIGAAIAVLLLLLTMAVVNRALAPIGWLAAAMTRIEAGDYQTRVEPDGPPELAAICAKLNHLAATLGEAIEDKRRLAARVVSLQDVERKELARELHDEFGPFLFALRAHATATLRIAEAPAPDLAALQRHGAAMLEQVNALQQSNRRVLERLRPAGLSELGLREALQALARLWREAHPGVGVALSIAPLDASEIVELTVYRVVQEALTNAFRHATASQVAVSVEPTPASATTPRNVVVRVQDDGKGLPADHKLGHGLIGMRERVLALGGRMTMESADRGLTVEAVIPLGAVG